MKPAVYILSALVGTAGSLFMAGWATHAGMWGIVVGSGLVGAAGMLSLGVLWILFFD